MNGVKRVWFLLALLATMGGCSSCGDTSVALPVASMARSGTVVTGTINKRKPGDGKETL